MSLTNPNPGDLVSYLTLRRVVGLLGVGLPLVLALWGFALCGCGTLLPSISDYYALRTRDAFVGILFTVAWFLFTYRGYERKDDIAGDIACLFAMGVALFPNTGSPAEQAVHFTSASGMFLTLAYFSWYLFTKSGPTMTPEKRIRNRVYRVCAVAIVACIALIGLSYALLPKEAREALKPVFWLESLALWAFGVSWFVKGETVWRDRAEAPPMRPRISLLTLGVRDLERALGFYRDGLGLPTKGVVGQEFEHGAVAFFDLERGLKLAIWPRREIARDCGLQEGPPSPTEFTIAHNVSRPEEVDRVMALAGGAGARIVKAAERTFWGGYAGYFQDPDGHLWEVVWNPAMLPDG